MENTRRSRQALVADIGGTNARFALVDLTAPDRVPSEQRTLAVADHRTLRDAAQTYLDDLRSRRSGWRAPVAAAFAVATAITGDRVKLTNSPWSFSINAVREQLHLKTLHVVNDFTALAWALPTLRPAELHRIGGGRPDPHAARALIGPGTGLGVSGLIAAPGGNWVALQSEGGHVLLSPADAREAAVLAAAWRQVPDVSFERLVSGTGLPLLARCVAQVDGTSASALNIDDPALDGEAIVNAARAGDRLGGAVVTMFCALLGTAAGNLALTLGARGGVYIGGGIVPRLGPMFEQSPFRARFESDGRHSGYLQRIPTWVIEPKHGSPALAGVAQALLAHTSKR